jgi:hypothetical protein
MQYCCKITLDSIKMKQILLIEVADERRFQVEQQGWSRKTLEEIKTV